MTPSTIARWERLTAWRSARADRMWAAAKAWRYPPNGLPDPYKYAALAFAAKVAGDNSRVAHELFILALERATRKTGANPMRREA